MKEINTLGNRNVVRQSNLLINARYKVSAVSLDLFFLLLTEINSRDSDTSIYKIKLREVELRLNKRLDRKYLEKIGDELTGYGVKIPKEEGGFLIVNLLSSFEYYKGHGVIEMEVSNKIKPYILSLKEKFTKASLIDITTMQSEYSKRLFLMLEQRKKLGRWSVSLAELQNILCVSQSLIPFGAFNREVLKISLRDINNSDSLSVEIESYDKIGRTVTGINFKIRSKLKEPKMSKNPTKEEIEKEKWRVACDPETYSGNNEDLDMSLLEEEVVIEAEVV